MLHYTEADLSPLEVPDEQALCIYLSGCQNHCPDCHYPELCRPDCGDPLRGNFEKLLLLYLRYCTCICFMGEGEHTGETRQELTGYAAKYGKMAMQMPWPTYDEAKTVDANVEMAVQVNGKLKGTVIVPVDSDQETVVAAAKEIEKVKKATDGMQIFKVIHVKNKLVNLIAKPAK